MSKHIRNSVTLFFTAIVLLLSCMSSGQKNVKEIKINTQDLAKFWNAYDLLKTAPTKKDSINIIENEYLYKLSKAGKSFIKLRKYSSDEFITSIKKYPKYFEDLRHKTINLEIEKTKISEVLIKLHGGIPDFKMPNVNFAMGCFRGGGTTHKGFILLGAELALADSTMNISEFNGWLYEILSKSDGDIGTLVAHESIHIQQFNGQNNSLLSLALHEGTADFLTKLILGKTINSITEDYGIQNECTLWNEFRHRAQYNEVSAWLFNSGSSNGRPPDLGYFVGMRICQSYYDKQMDKQKAIKFLINRGNYKKVLEEGGYNGNCD